MNPGGFGYCTHTWNPMVGCGREKLSAGCTNCWAEKMAMRHKYRKDVIEDKRWNGAHIYIAERLKKPNKVKKRAVIAVGFMGDIFSDLPAEPDGWHYHFLKNIWDTMFVASQHTFLVLTKRPDNMLRFCEWMISRNRNPFYGHVWFGASASDQDDIERVIAPMVALKKLSIDQRDEANTWLSLEPLLECIDLQVEHGREVGDLFIDTARRGQPIDQIIVGGESGHNARPMPEQWPKAIIDDSRAAGIPVYMKQMSGRVDIPPHLDIKQLAWSMPK